MPDNKTKQPRTALQRSSHGKKQKKRKRSTSVSRQSPPTAKKTNSLSSLDISKTSCSMTTEFTNSCRMPRVRSADPYLKIDESPQLTSNRPLRKSRIIKRGTPSSFREMNSAAQPHKQKPDQNRPTSRPPSRMAFQWNTHESIKTSFFTVSSGNDSKSDGKEDGAQKPFNLRGTYKRTSIKKVVSPSNASSIVQSPVNHMETLGVKKGLSTIRSPEPPTVSKCAKKLVDTKSRSKSPKEVPHMRSPGITKPQARRQSNGDPAKPGKEPSRETLNTSTFSGVSHSSRSPLKSWVWFTEESGSPSRNTVITPPPRADKEKMLEKILLDAMKYSPIKTKGTSQEKSNTVGSPEKVRYTVKDKPIDVTVSQPAAQSLKKWNSNDVGNRSDSKICDTKGISLSDMSLMMSHRYCPGSPTSIETCLSESRDGSSFSGLDTFSHPSKQIYFSSGSTENSEVSITSASQESLFIQIQRDMKKTTPHGFRNAKNCQNESQRMSPPAKVLNKLKCSPVIVESEQIFQPSVIYAPPMPYTNSTASTSKPCDGDTVPSSQKNSVMNSNETSISTLPASCPVFEFKSDKKVANLPTTTRKKPLVKPWVPFSSKRQVFSFKKGIVTVTSRDGELKRNLRNSACSVGSTRRKESSTQEKVSSGVVATSSKFVPKKDEKSTKKLSDSTTRYHFRRINPNLNRNKETLTHEARFESSAIQLSEKAGMKSPVKAQRPLEEKSSSYKHRVRQKYVRGKNQVSTKPENSYPLDKASRPNTPNDTDKQLGQDYSNVQKCSSKQASTITTRSTTASSVYQTSFRKIRNSPIFHHLIRTLVEQFGKIRMPSRHNFHGSSSKPASGRVTPTTSRLKKISKPHHDVAVAADLPLEANTLANAFTNASDSIEALTFLGESRLNSQRKIKIRVSVNPPKKKLENISYRESVVTKYDQERLYLPTVQGSSQSTPPCTDVTLFEQERNLQTINTSIHTSLPGSCVKRNTGMNDEGRRRTLSPELKPVQQPMVSNMCSQGTPDHAKELTGFYTFYSENSEESKNNQQKCSSQTWDQETSWEDAVEASRRPTPNSIATPMRYTVRKKGLERKKYLSRRLNPLLREPHVRTLFRFMPITLLVLSFFYIVRVISNLPHSHH